jgi:hypothetical protein
MEMMYRKLLVVVGFVLFSLSVLEHKIRFGLKKK